MDRYRGKMDRQIKGSKIDWEKFNKLREERWKKKLFQYYFCTIHKTYFKYGGDKNDPRTEPCWGCYNECEIKL